MNKVFIVYYIPNGYIYYFDSKKAAKAFMKKVIADNPKNTEDTFEGVSKADFDEIEEVEVYTETKSPKFEV